MQDNGVASAVAMAGIVDDFSFILTRKRVSKFARPGSASN
jgi:hypothetical protein